MTEVLPSSDVSDSVHKVKVIDIEEENKLRERVNSIKPEDAQQQKTSNDRTQLLPNLSESQIFLSSRGSSAKPSMGINPFVNSTLELSLFGWIRFIIASLTIAPIRFILIILLFCIIWVFLKIAVCNLPHNRDVTEPLAKWRKILLIITRGLSRVTLFVWGIYWIQVKGTKSTYKEAPIIVANHVSWFDVLYFGYSELPRFVSRIENLKLPFIGSFLIAINAILLDRSNLNDKRAAVTAIIQHARSCEQKARRSDDESDTEASSDDEDNNNQDNNTNYNSNDDSVPRLLIFPAGTCSNQKALISFKAGAFIPGSAVQPVAISYPFIHFDPCWVNGVNVPFAIWRSLCQFQNYMTVTYLPVHHPTQAEKQDPLLYANNVRERIARELNIPVTEHSFDDVKFQFEAMKLHLPPELISEVDIVHLKKFYGMGVSEKDLKDMLERFSSFDSKKKGKFTLEEFARVLNVPVESEVIQRLFYTLDMDEDGVVSWREYISGLAFLNKQLGDSDKVKLAFGLFDVEKEGKVRKSSLFRILKNVMPSITENEVNKLFKAADTNADGWIDINDFLSFLHENPEYYSLIHYFQEKDGDLGNKDYYAKRRKKAKKEAKEAQKKQLKRAMIEREKMFY